MNSDLDEEFEEVEEEEREINVRPELKQFMDALGIGVDDLKKNAKDPFVKMQNQNSSLAPSGQQAAQQVQQMLQQQPFVPMPSPISGLQRPISANTGGIIVKGEIRVEEKYVDSVKGVMSGIQQEMADADGDTVELTEEQRDFIAEMMNMVEVKKSGEGTTLDQALVTEMGKAYKTRFELAKAAGDDKAMNQAYGSMLALKKVLEMVK